MGKGQTLFPRTTVTVLSVIFSIPVFFISFLWFLGRVEQPSRSIAVFGIIMFSICAGYIVYIALTSRVFIYNDHIVVYSFLKPQSIKYEQIVFVENEILKSHRGYTPVIILHSDNKRKYNILSKGYNTEDLAQFLRLIKLKNKQVKFSEEIEALSRADRSKQTTLLFKTIKYSWFGVLVLLIMVNVIRSLFTN